MLADTLPLVVVWVHSHNVCLCVTAIRSISWWTLWVRVRSAIQIINIPLYLQYRAHMDSQRTKNIHILESVLSKGKLFHHEHNALYHVLKHRTLYAWPEDEYWCHHLANQKAEIDEPVLWHINSHTLLKDLKSVY